MKEVKIFCDGSSLGNPGFGGWCAMICYKNYKKIFSDNEADTTNNRMELTAAIKGLEALKEPCSVEIISDSQYVCNGINVWLKGWRAKNFKNVKNVDLWCEYLEKSSQHIVKASWIRGHNGHKENEECDRIARIEAEKLKEVKCEILT